MNVETRDLFLRVAGKQGWLVPGGLDSAEEELLRSIGAGGCTPLRVMGSNGEEGDPSTPKAECHPTQLLLSDSEWEGSSGKENCKAVCWQNRTQLDSSDDDFDQFLIEKATPRTIPQRERRRPLNTHSPRVQVLSSDSDSFEDFLSRVRTPKSKPHVSLGNSSDDSLRHFIVNSCSSDEDFAPDRRKKQLTSAKDLCRPPLSQPAVRRPPSQWESPVFISNSEEEEEGSVGGGGLVMRSTWVSQKRGNSAGQIGRPMKDAQPRKAASERRPRQAPNPGCHPASGSSSEEEFESLLDRIRKNHSLGTSVSHTPLTSAEPRSSLSKPSVLPEQVPRGRHRVQPKVTPGQTAVSRPSGSHTKPRPPNSSRVAVCQTPGCFLQALSDLTSHYAKNFKQHREELSSKLYQLYNSTVFDSKLPSSMSLSWNKKMRKTAGYCVSGMERGPGGQRYARIELSEKVCDSAERLRDTLVHEMCHAATWLVHGVRDGHGRFWQLFARKAVLAHPELPVVTRCHSYQINYKYQYKCSRCQNTIGRHSKSLDTGRFVCALCTGQLVLVTPSRTRGPTPFATFVKEHYSTTRQELGQKGSQAHAEVMRKLSADFAAQTRLTES
ncbi:ACRC protein, partial [Amia calva]|nr:ACRC protein [Amia calva]